jgi:hypothetical protein
MRLLARARGVGVRVGGGFVAGGGSGVGGEGALGADGGGGEGGGVDCAVGVGGGGGWVGGGYLGGVRWMRMDGGGRERYLLADGRVVGWCHGGGCDVGRLS